MTEASASTPSTPTSAPTPLGTGGSAPADRRQYVLTLACEDRPGIVYAVASFLIQHGCNILQSEQFDDHDGTDPGTFFMRVKFTALDPVETLDRLRNGFLSVADSFQMQWRLVDASTRCRTLVLVSKFGHCLNDLLFRHRIGALSIDIPAVVSNHREFEDLVQSHGIPFIHIPVTKDTKPEAEKQLLEIVDREQIDLVVLARYMQVLSPELCQALSGRAINIHHSFLPSFKGARPYQQAHARGVKIIGATAHYVTSDLDEGPIIEQDVQRVTHATSAEQMAAAGRDVECQVLSRAVTWHAENKVMINGTKTVVFS
ncbi:formyltetrahydrofolate deformylase [Kineosporia sp. NBRC 101731]|uniref:formyltetrahydrofolate deformylase n=1 Tax=Kineosporia sp. NBRC 101731 TaxID=3032199 RepID=UPI0024A2C299|nr:formyltetrahydrofolate deformylase [Kineosporia sp. NBRC 101731]GLY27796.1 formyltetrahydrofolate deformylase [Kineosporia sp. NBRC 101731]